MNDIKYIEGTKHISIIGEKFISKTPLQSPQHML